MNVRKFALSFITISLSSTCFATQFSLNERKSSNDVWLEIIDQPYVRAHANYFTHSGHAINDKGCGVGRFDGFCNEKEYIDVMKPICRPLFDKVSLHFGSIYDYTGDYKPLGDISNEYRRAYYLYDNYWGALIKNQRNRANIDGLSKEDRRHEFDVLNSLIKMNKKWSEEKLESYDSLSQSIWRSSNAYDNMLAGEGQIKDNIKKVNQRSFNGQDKAAASKITNSSMVAGLNNGLNKLVEQRRTSHRDDPNTIYNAAQFYSSTDSGALKMEFLAYPACALQLYNGKKFISGSSIKRPDCLKLLDVQKSNVVNRWSNKCSDFVNSESQNDDVVNWLQNINYNNNNYDTVKHDYRMPKQDNSSSKNEFKRLSGLYGPNVMKQITDLAYKTKSDQEKKASQRYKELQHQATQARKQSDPERVKFIRMLNEDMTITDNNRNDLIRQYDDKFFPTK